MFPFKQKFYENFSKYVLRKTWISINNLIGGVHSHVIFVKLYQITSTLERKAAKRMLNLFITQSIKMF